MRAGILEMRVIHDNFGSPPTLHPLNLTYIDEKNRGGSRNSATTKVKLCVAKLLDFLLKRNNIIH